jgi:Fe-S oxidoreductase
MKAPCKLTDIASNEDRICRIGEEDLISGPFALETLPFRDLDEETRKKFCCDLDDLLVLSIPRPRNRAEEEDMVERFLAGLRKLLSPENNWPFLSQLETSLDYCAQCNSCSAACHLFAGSGGNEMYRPNFRSEIFRRIYKQYIVKEPLVRLRRGDFPLDWRVVARLGELSYRCNICRRCAQVCPIGVDNGLIAREIRKIFSQEMGINPPEMHSKGSMYQLEFGSSTRMRPAVMRENVDFIDEDYAQSTGFDFQTPWDKEGADILLIHNAGEVLAWPESIAAYSLIFQAAGISFTLSSELAAYDSINYGVFYDDVQLARVALLQAQAAKKLGVKKIVIGECGHAHKALTVIADRILPAELNIPRESCFPLLRDIVFSGKLRFDPTRNDFPVTLHDPCNIVRLMGISKPQRDILHLLCPRFREMNPHGTENYCCGGGSGLYLMTRNNIETWRNNISGRRKMEQIGTAFADCLEAKTRKYICAPCSNCKGQIRDILRTSDLTEKYNLHYGGLAELVVNAMSDVKPGFIKWEEDE